MGEWSEQERWGAREEGICEPGRKEASVRQRAFLMLRCAETGPDQQCMRADLLTRVRITAAI